MKPNPGIVVEAKYAFKGSGGLPAADIYSYLVLGYK
jgi:hypothetical protein